MKKLWTLSVFFISIQVCAQFSPKEIKKFKISKITKLTTADGSEAVEKTETWYDSNGNDTAQYVNGEMIKRKKYEYNEKNQALKSTSYGGDGNDIETTVYTYNADGSCTISNTDKNFGMTDLTYCDKSGKTTKTQSPDGTQRIYTYDANGRLIKIKSKPDNNGGIVTDIQCSYNTKGQLSKEISKGDNKWTHSYAYDPKGLIVKCRTSSETDGVADPGTTVSYQYEFHK